MDVFCSLVPLLQLRKAPQGAALLPSAYTAESYSNPRWTASWRYAKREKGHCAHLSQAKRYLSKTRTRSLKPFQTKPPMGYASKVHTNVERKKTSQPRLRIGALRYRFYVRRNQFGALRVIVRLRPARRVECSPGGAKHVFHAVSLSCV